VIERIIDKIYTCTIVDLFYENVFFRAISHRRTIVECDEKCSSGKHINNSIPIEDLIRRRQGRQYNVTLLHTDINDDMFVSCL